LDLAILNSFHFLALCGAKMTHGQFRLALLWNLIEEPEVYFAQVNPERDQWFGETGCYHEKLNSSNKCDW
jgi:hypothetical protein